MSNGYSTTVSDDHHAAVLRKTHLNVRHRVDRFGKPLLIIENLPGEGAEVYPEKARAYARALLQAADDCEKPWPQRLKRKHIQRNERQSYPLSTD